MNPDARTDKKISTYGLAIITGGSSGIGKSIIERIRKVQVAPRVCNLSRTKPETFLIDPIGDHLECDLSDSDIRRSVFKRTADYANSHSPEKPILLVNNAGFGLYDNIDNHPVEEHLELIQVNVSALVELTLALLPLLKERGGSIMNIVSTSAFQATPHLATYGASKAFVLSWTLALNEELRPFPKTNAIAICPGPTRTNFFKRAGFTGHVVPGGFSMPSEAVAEKALRALSKGKAYSVIGYRNRLIAEISSRLPRGIGTRLSAAVVGRFRSANSKPDSSCQ